MRAKYSPYSPLYLLSLGLLGMVVQSCTENDQTAFAVQPSTSDESAESSNEISYGRFPGQYLLAFFSCDGSICMQPNAFNHQIWLAYSDDGIEWSLPDPQEVFEGSVPDLLRRKDTLYVYGARGKMRRYHFDSDEWEDLVEHKQVVADGEQSIRWNDFSPVLGEDGLIHLFFLASSVASGDPAECPATSTETCTQRFASAIEVEGSDGAEFTVYPEWNLEIELQPGERASDPDVFQLRDGRWAMYITWREGTAMFVSDTLHGTYTPMEGLGMPPYIASPYFGLGVGYYHAQTDMYWTFVNTPTSRDDGDGINISIQRAEHVDFTELIDSELQTVLQQGSSGIPENYWTASPGFALNTP